MADTSRIQADPASTGQSRRAGERFDPRVRFRVLGPLCAVVADPGEAGVVEIGLGGPKQQLVLALLLTQPNRPVSTDILIDGLWGDAPPASARHTVQGYVSELRRVVGDAIRREGAGYVARVDESTLDSLEFEAMVIEGEAGLAADPDSASTLLRAAEALWRGEPFEGFGDSDAIDGERRRLAEKRMSAIESRIEAELALGRHGELVGELDRLTHEHRYREELRAQHMVALYRAGRQAEALRAYQHTRSVLADDLGIDPSPGLRRLEEQILVQDPALDLAGSDDTVADVDRPVVNPYKGLRPFSAQDVDDFFGRERLVDHIVGLVDSGADLVALVGPSGSGKSSLLHAGVGPALGGDPTWVAATMLPGSHPFDELEAALLRAVARPPATIIDDLTDTESGLQRVVLRLLDEGQRLVLLVDQFEELFTLVDDSLARSFLTCLLTAINDPRGRVRLVISLRADFYEEALRHPDLARVLTGNVVNVIPLDLDSLEAAAVGPAARMGVGFEPGVLAALLADVAGQPNALPLFQYTLAELFDRRAGSELTSSAYEELGGLRQAVGIGAEEAYRSLDPAQQEAARQLFLRLMVVGDSGVTRRRVTAVELLALDLDVVAMQVAVDVFVRHRLLTLDRHPTSGGPVIDLAHEALLTEWGRLRGWIADHRDTLRRYPPYASLVEEWLTSGRDPGFLLSGARLEQYAEWRAVVPIALTASERQFLDEAVQARGALDAVEAERLAEQERLRRQARRARMAVAAMVLALAGVAVAFVLSGGGSATTVAVVGYAFDDDQINELSRQGLERAEGDFELAVDRYDLLLPPGEMLDELSADLVVLDTDESLAVSEHLDAFDPDVHYLAADIGDPDFAAPNLTVLGWNDEEVGFLAGVAAAATSRTGTVGYIGATPIQDVFRSGYEAGARWVDRDVVVVASVLSDFGIDRPYDDPAAGRAAADRLNESGADVVFHAAGRSGFGIFAAAAELSTPDRQFWAIGVDTDQWQTASEDERPHVLTSILKRVDQQVYEAIGDFAEGRLEAGRRAGTVAGGLTDFSTSGNHLGPDALAELENARAGLGANEIDLVFRLTGKLIGPEPVHFVRVEIDGTSCTVTVDEASGGGASDGSTVIDESEGVEFSVVGDAGTDAAHWFGVEGSMFFFELGDGPPVVRSARLPAGDHQLVVYPSPSEENADPIVCGELRVATVG